MENSKSQEPLDERENYEAYLLHNECSLSKKQSSQGIYHQNYYYLNEIFSNNLYKNVKILCK